MAKIYLMIIVLGIVSSVGYAAKSYYEWSQETITTLRENNVKLKGAAETLQATVEKMTADAEKNEKLNKDLSKRLQQSQEHLDKLLNTEIGWNCEECKGRPIWCTPECRK